MAESSTVRVELHDDVAVVRMASGHHNRLGPQLVEDLLDVLRRPEVAEESRALVLAGSDQAFCGGLDLDALGELGRGRILAFVDRLQGLLATLYVWSRPVVAAVAGDAAGTGCLLAMCADWRVLGDGPLCMGLDEINLGLPLLQAGQEITRAHLTGPSWHQVAVGGELHDPTWSVKLGLADELVPMDRVESMALERATTFGARPMAAFHRVKAGFREPVLLKIREHHETHQEEWVNFWFSPAAEDRRAQARTVSAD